MSRETFWSVMTHGNAMPDGFDPKKEMKRLEAMTLPLPDDEGDDDDEQIEE